MARDMSGGEDKPVTPGKPCGRQDAPGIDALTGELTDALTALGIWLSAAEGAGRPPDPAAIDHILARATGQYRRAARAFRRLRAAGWHGAGMGQA